MPPRRPTDRPNIVLINCDDLGYGDLGCYGSNVNRTPALDRLAAGGTRFTSFYMASPVCSPSRSAMLTGSYPVRVGIPKVLFPGDPIGLSPDEITVADLLRGQGYATKLVGKWHCGDQPEFLPTRHGFDSYFGIPYSNDMGRQQRLVPSKRIKPPLPLMENETVLQEQPDQAALTERYVEHCVRFLREHSGQPFFLYLAHMYVHVPIYPPERFLRESQNGRYGAAVECIDWSVSVIMDELRRLGILENTLVIFTSDNGSRARDEGGSNLPLRGHKAQNWEGGQRVPCIAHWPGMVPAATCGEMVTGMDFLPTFCGLTGAKAPDERILDGRDIAPLLFGESGARSPHEAFFYYHLSSLSAVRAGAWKLHVWRDEQPVLELYNLDADIAEQENVAERNPHVVKELMRHIERARADLGDKATGAVGTGCRKPGLCEAPRTLTEYDPSHPYIIAEYDLTATG